MYSKGQFIAVKSPPYYEKEYIYQISAAGEKQIKAELYKSPKVRKSWSVKEFSILIKMDVIRLLDEKESAKLQV